MKVGDWVEPIDRELDPREVAAVEGDAIWIRLLGPEPVGPLPKANYVVSTTKERHEEIVDDMIFRWDGKGSRSVLSEHGHVHDAETNECLKRRRGPQCVSTEGRA